MVIYIYTKYKTFNANKALIILHKSNFLYIILCSIIKNIYNVLCAILCYIKKNRKNIYIYIYIYICVCVCVCI